MSNPQNLSLGSSHRSINQHSFQLQGVQNFHTFQQIPSAQVSGSFRVVEPEPHIHISQPSQPASHPHSQQQQQSLPLSQHLNRISELQHLSVSRQSHAPSSRILDSQLLKDEASIEYGMKSEKSQYAPSEPNHMHTSNISDIERVE